jgi:hypothetical protein
MKKVAFLLTLFIFSFSYAKKFLIKIGDVIDGNLKVGIILPKKQNQSFQMPYQELKEKEPPQVYPVSITLTSPQFTNCNGVGELIYNQDFNRFYGNISKISCDENGKIKEYETKGYILDSSSNIGLDPNQVKPNANVKIMIVKEIK